MKLKLLIRKKNNQIRLIMRIIKRTEMIRTKTTKTTKTNQMTSLKNHKIQQQIKIANNLNE